MKLNHLSEDEYSNKYVNYVKEVENINLIEEFEISLHEFIKFIQNIPMDKFNYRYEETKWTIKEIIQHLIDTERIFTYRALRFSRNDTTQLSGFDENEYVNNTDANDRNIQNLLAEFSAVRHSSLFLYKSFSEEQLKRTGIASNNKISVRAIGFVCIGHQKHHQRIFKERYL